MFTKNSLLFLVLFITVIFLLPSSIDSDVVGADVAQAAQATALPAPQFTAVDFTATSTITTDSTTSTTSTSSGQASAASSPAPVGTPKTTIAIEPDTREHLVIPSIGVNAPIDPVGINSLGQMAVPSGSTNDVGWYKFGTAPGDIGSAVIDAHVFAGFAELHNIKIGESIYVDPPDGKQLRFVVQDIENYPLADVPTGK